jgi:proton-coupled amino acid transporter
MLHYKAVAKTPVEKIGDILLCVFGMAAMVYTTAQTIKVLLDFFFDVRSGTDVLCS